MQLMVLLPALDPYLMFALLHTDILLMDAFVIVDLLALERGFLNETKAFLLNDCDDDKKRAL